MERFEALEIIRIYETSSLVIPHGKDKAIVYKQREELVLKAQKVLLADEDKEEDKEEYCWNPGECKCEVPCPCDEETPDAYSPEWLKKNFAPDWLVELFEEIEKGKKEVFDVSFLFDRKG